MPPILPPALEFLEAAALYELGVPQQLQLGTLYPAYLRGKAQLMAHHGRAAAVEFQKFLDHRGIVVNFPLGALAHLGLAPRLCDVGRHARAKLDYYREPLAVNRRLAQDDSNWILRAQACGSRSFRDKTTFSRLASG